MSQWSSGHFNVCIHPFHCLFVKHCNYAVLIPCYRKPRRVVHNKLRRWSECRARKWKRQTQPVTGQRKVFVETIMEDGDFFSVRQKNHSVVFLRLDNNGGMVLVVSISFQVFALWQILQKQHSWLKKNVPLKRRLIRSVWGRRQFKWHGHCISINLKVTM